MRWQIETLAKSKQVRTKPLKAIAVVLLTAAFTLAAQAYVNSFLSTPYFFFFFLAGLFVAWRFGLVPGLMSILFCVLGAALFYYPAASMLGLNEVIPLSFVAVCSGVCVWLVVQLKNNETVSSLVQEELETTLASIGDGVIVVDRHKHVAFLNSVAEKLTGWKNTEARGKPMEEVFNIINEKTRKPVHNPVERVLKEGVVVGLANHTILISKDGVHRSIEDSAAPIVLKNDPDMAGVVLVFRDVTAKFATEREGAEARRTLEAVFEELSDGVVITDDHGGNVRMNRAALRMHGFDANGDMYDHLQKYQEAFRLFDTDGNPLAFEEWPLAKVLRNEWFHDEEVVVKRSDGKFSFTASYSGSPILDEDGRVKLAVLTVRDISRKAMIEAELRRAKNEAETASSLKTSFLANMSHEIRTPMTAVLGFTEVLRNTSLSEADRHDALTRIERSGRSLLKLIDDILDVSKIEAGKVEIQKSRFSPLEIASEVISLLRVQTDKKNVEIRLTASHDLPDTACSDPMRIRQVLTNLVGNSVKFTEEGRVDVAIEAEGENLKFRVSDSGIGIRQEDQRKLFQPFAQADGSITRRFGGSGLGLMLSREIARALGGSLELESSELGKGSSFVALIPAAPFQRSKRDAVHSMNSNGGTQSEFINEVLSGVALLVAEDVPDNQRLLKIYLSAAGVKQLDLASNGEEAVEMAMAGKYDAVLMDIQMPGMDGIQATRKLRKLGFKRPIVALTAHAMPEEIRRTVEAGCDGHIAKPVQRDHLISTVAEFARRGDRE